LRVFQEAVEPQELQGPRQPARDAAGRRLVLQEEVSDHRAGSMPLLIFKRHIQYFNNNILILEPESNSLIVKHTWIVIIYNSTKSHVVVNSEDGLHMRANLL
jgi:hypothetical protein